MLTIGLDLDDKGKPTAIAVVATEKRKDERGREALHRDIWFLERLSDLDEEAMRRMAEIVDQASERHRGRVPVYVNVTGPGKPALGALRFHRVTPPRTPVYLRDGDERVDGANEVWLGKGWLVYRLQELLESDRVQLLEAARARGQELKQELLDYRLGDEPGPLMVALGLALHKEWSGMWRIRTF